MAVQAQFVLPPYAAAEEQQPMRALKEYGALMSAAVAVTPVADDRYASLQYDYCTAQSELTCNGGGGGGSGVAVPVPVPSRKRGRDDDDNDLCHYYAPPLLPLPMMQLHSAMLASTSGRPAEEAPPPEAADQVWRYGAAEVDAVVRAECDRLRAEWLELARRERLRRAMVRAAAVSSSGMLARRAREAEALLEAARRRTAELEERVVLAAAEAQAWCAVARGNEELVPQQVVVAPPQRNKHTEKLVGLHCLV